MRPRYDWLTKGGLVTCAVLMSAGCSESAPPVLPTHLEIVQGPPPAAVPGAFLVDTLRVRLVDSEGRPRSGEPIAWIVRQGGGTVIPLQTSTDAGGVASARWSLGPISGANEIEARTLDDSVLVLQSLAEAFRADHLASNYGFACGIRSGDLWCWGNSWVRNDPVSEGPNPDWGPFWAPGFIAGEQGFTQAAVSHESACALDGAGVVHCFYPAPSSLPSKPGFPPLRQLLGSWNSFYCGLAAADSTAWCWNISGVPAMVPNSPAFWQLETYAAGGTLTGCGLLVDSTAVCWGEGPLGDGTFNASPTPVPVSGGHKFVELALGEDFGCGLKNNGEVWCWGKNADSQLGQAGPDAPDPILATTGVSRISAAMRTVIAIKAGVVVRWGWFGNGQGNPITPLASVAGLPVMDFASTDISCLRLVDHQVYCFDEIFVNATGAHIDHYTPVQPVISP